MRSELSLDHAVTARVGHGRVVYIFTIILLVLRTYTRRIEVQQLSTQWLHNSGSLHVEAKFESFVPIVGYASSG